LPLVDSLYFCGVAIGNRSEFLSKRKAVSKGQPFLFYPMVAEIILRFLSPGGNKKGETL